MPVWWFLYLTWRQYFSCLQCFQLLLAEIIFYITKKTWNGNNILCKCSSANYELPLKLLGNTLSHKSSTMSHLHIKVTQLKKLCAFHKTFPFSLMSSFTIHIITVDFFLIFLAKLDSFNPNIIKVSPNYCLKLWTWINSNCLIPYNGFY